MCAYERSATMTQKATPRSRTVGDSDTASPTPETVAALGAIYESERQDLTGIFGHSITLVGIAVAYIGVLATVISQNASAIPPYIIGWVAVPVWLMIAFYTLSMALIIAHGQSVDIVERRLVSAAGLDELRVAIGAAVGTQVTDVDKLMKTKRWSLAWLSYIVYGGFFILTACFTGFILWMAYETVQTVTQWLLMFELPLIFYTLCTVVEAFAVKYIFGRMRADLRRDDC